MSFATNQPKSRDEQLDGLLKQVPKLAAKVDALEILVKAFIDTAGISPQLQEAVSHRHAKAMPPKNAFSTREAVDYSKLVTEALTALFPLQAPRNG